MNLAHHHRTTTRTALGALTLATALALTGCGSSGGSSGGSGDSSAPSATPSSPSASSSASPSPSTSGSASAAATITIKNYAYSTSGTIKPGSTVMIKNEDTEAHTVTADNKGGFDVKVGPHATAMLKAPSAAGTYAYHCTYHANMHGKLVVG